MVNKLKKQLKNHRILFGSILFGVICIFIASLIPVSFPRSLLIVFGGIFYLFTPGFFLTIIIFPKIEKTKFLHLPAFNQETKLDWLERVVLSIFLSIAVITLCLTIIRQLNIQLSGWFVFLTIVATNLITFGGVLIKLRYKKRKSPGT